MTNQQPPPLPEVRDDIDTAELAPLEQALAAILVSVARHETSVLQSELHIVSQGELCNQPKRKLRAS